MPKFRNGSVFCARYHNRMSGPAALPSRDDANYITLIMIAAMIRAVGRFMV